MSQTETLITPSPDTSFSPPVLTSPFVRYPLSMLAGSNYLLELIHAERLTAIVDIGANPVDGNPPYLEMLRAGLCTVTGFEPQPDALGELERESGPLERYLPYAIADGSRRTLKKTAASGMTSLLEPDPIRLAMFNGFQEWGRVVDRVSLETIRLDDVSEIEHMDMLKIDVQGAERLVFQGGQDRLKKAVVVHTEVSFVPLYTNQPSFADIDHELRSLGFLPHAVAALKRWPLAPVVYDGDFRKPMHQLLEADLVYARDLLGPNELTDDELRHLCLISHCVYGSSDLAHLTLTVLGERGLVPPGAPARYLEHAHPI